MAAKCVRKEICARAGAGTGSVATSSGGIEGGAGGGRTWQREWCGEGSSSGSLLRVCCVDRCVNELGELQKALTAASCT
eukprot:SAG25_NODE_376_length_8856_cov_9.128354_2_plen_79_part_00